jgi:hypothetical protein
MKRIQEIRAKRERVFTRKRWGSHLSQLKYVFNLLILCLHRLQGKKEHERSQKVKMVQKNIELIATPGLKQKLMEKKLSATASTKDMEIA